MDLIIQVESLATRLHINEKRIVEGIPRNRIPEKRYHANDGLVVFINSRIMQGLFDIRNSRDNSLWLRNNEIACSSKI